MKAPDRQAAGCTPDIDEENYHEYSTFFFAALHGRDRTGQPVPTPDYDRDGRVSFAEAHAYAQIASDTIDIPLATSDVFLRQFSSASLENPHGLVTADDPFDQLRDRATPAQAAILDALSARLELTGQDRVREARSLATSIEKDRRKLAQQKNRLTADYNRTRSRLRGRLKSRWPELVTAYHPRAQAILDREGDRVRSFIESQEAFPRWERIADQIADLEEKQTTLERKWVKCQRFLRCAESVALAANLDKVATPALRTRYDALLALESQTLRPPDPSR